jgi:hypothetical protein
MSELNGYDMIVAASRQSVGSSAKAVLCWLAYFADRNTRTCYPCQDLLASLMGSTDRTVRNALTELAKKKLITRDKRRVGNRQTSDLITLSKAIFQAERNSGSKVFSGGTSRTYRRNDVPGNYKELEPHPAEAESAPRKNKSIRP